MSMNRVSLPLRGSILDVYSYSCEYPFRIDFFGDEIDAIRTFDVENQLSKDKRELIEIVPELASVQSIKQSFLSFLPSDALVVIKIMPLCMTASEKSMKMVSLLRLCRTIGGQPTNGS